MKRFKTCQTYLSFLLIMTVFLITGCAGSSNNPTKVSAVSTLKNAATGVATNTKISAVFSEAMDPATINTTTYTLKQGVTAVSGAVTYSGVTAVFAPATLLAASTTYTATITTGAKDLAGNAMAADYVWTFTTSAGPDLTPPAVSLTAPANGVTGVFSNTKIAASFTKTMDPLTITTQIFTVKQGATPVAGAVTYSGATATFTPDSSLGFSTTYTATITTGAKDLAGNSLAADYVWTFTTGVAPDTTPPTVSFTAPLNGAVAVPFNRIIQVAFSEAMDPLTITATTFKMTSPGLLFTTNPVAGTVASIGTTATFIPTGNLAANTVYTATITSGVKDLAGNSLATDFVWSFTTGAAADITPPTLSFTAPTNGQTAVPLNRIISVAFSEVMDPLTITTTTFSVTDPAGTSVLGNVAPHGTTATFTPTSNLAVNTLYTGKVTTGVKDLAGNAMIANYVWTFTTGVALDTTRPTVSSAIPVTNATGVALNSNMTATFSEVMDPSTITTVTFTLTQGGTPVAGAVTYSGVTAIFIPNAYLTGSTLYTATITTGAKDLAGNSLAVDYAWTFTTGAAPDTTRPTVSSTIPVNNATGVALNSNMSATFSEAMDPLTITTVTFTLTQGGTPVAGAVTYSGVTATFKPNADLTGSTVYTATITTGARDLAGNALLLDKVWTFTTGAAPDTTRPIVILTVPADLATGVALNSNMSATFSEAMDPLTITTVTFTLTQGGAPVAGAVTYSGVTATFKPNADLTGSTLYTATITTGAKDLAGNALLVNKVWTFTTGAAPDTTRPTVTLTDPVNLATGIAISKKVLATFSEAMDPLTITSANFTLTQGGTPVAGTVTYVGFVATFSPDSLLASNTPYIATITSGAKDLAGNALFVDKVWTFTTVATLPLGPAPVNLGTAGDFVILTKTGITSTGVTAITGDIGVSPIDSTAITGFALAMDSTNTFSTSPLVTGKVYAANYTAPTPAKMTAAISDLRTAYLDAAGRATPDATELYGGNLSGKTIPPGLYKWSTGVSVDAASTVTLSGGANDVWIFQISGDITMNPGASVTLLGGAQAKNVFWQVGGPTGVTLDTSTAFKGILLVTKAIVFKNGATLVNGRALAETNVTLIANTITAP